MPRAITASKRQLSRAGRAPLGSITIPICLVLLIYLWFVSAGLWITWPRTAVFDYYNSLAAAFQVGQLSLQERPSEELLALPDPHRISARKNIEHIWDATLYNDRYYLYWGPVPALVLVPVRRLLGLTAIPDLYLVFCFIVGLFLVLSRTLTRVWTRSFAGSPPWTLSFGIVITGLAPPMAWMLNRPEVYEAALAAGQFFLLLGLYLCYSVVDGASRPVARLTLASLSLGLAVGSRTSEALPAIAILLVMSLFLLRERNARADRLGALHTLVAVWAPLSGIVLSLLWYNWARFGSVFEFGYRYQLTLMQMPKHYDELFSIAYLVPNLYNYLLNPFTLAIGFPPIRPQYGMAHTESTLAMPQIYFAEAVTGLVYTFPFMIFAAAILRPANAMVGQARDVNRQALRALSWLRAVLLIVLALEFSALLVFFFATQRYLVQVVPTLALAASIGWWQLLYAAQSDTARSRWTSVIGILLGTVSAATTLLLAVSSYQERIRAFNPAFLGWINGWLQR